MRKTKKTIASKWAQAHVMSSIASNRKSNPPPPRSPRLKDSLDLVCGFLEVDHHSSERGNFLHKNVLMCILYYR